MPLGKNRMPWTRNRSAPAFRQQRRHRSPASPGVVVWPHRGAGKTREHLQNPVKPCPAGPGSDLLLATPSARPKWRLSSYFFFCELSHKVAPPSAAAHRSDAGVCRPRGPAGRRAGLERPFRTPRSTILCGTGKSPGRSRPCRPAPRVFEFDDRFAWRNVVVEVPSHLSGKGRHRFGTQGGTCQGARIACPLAIPFSRSATMPIKALCRRINPKPGTSMANRSHRRRRPGQGPPPLSRKSPARRDPCGPCSQCPATLWSG